MPARPLSRCNSSSIHSSGESDNSRTLERNSSDLLGLSLNATRDVGVTSWVFGAELYHDRVESARVDVDLGTGARSERQARFPDGAEVANVAAFANASRPVAEAHTLSGGVRVNSVAIELPATAISERADIDIEDFSADLGWLWDLSDSLQLVANVGYGFRAPNIFDLGTLGERPGNRFNVPNPGLESERVTQFDLGLRQRRTNWTAELVVFRLDYRDKITSALTGDVTPGGRDVVQSVNAASAEVSGVEAGLRWHPAGTLSAEFVANYTLGEQREDDGSLAPGDRIPPLNGRLSVDWAFAEKWSMRTSLVFADAQDRLSPRDLRDSRIDPNGTPGWGVLDVGLRWRPGNAWSVNLGVENAFDRRYRAHGSGIDAPGINAYASAQAVW